MSDSKISSLPDGTTPAATDMFIVARSGSTTVKLTWAEILSALSHGPVVVNAADYGADPTGSADSSTAINNAIAALPATGGTVYIGPGNFKCNDTIGIGNGSSSGVSTRVGVVLLGAATPVGAAIVTGVKPPSGQFGICRLFSGAGVDMLHVNGPIQGWGVRNIHFDGVSVGLNGMVETSSQGGLSSGCAFTDFTQVAQKQTTLNNTGALSTVSTNTMYNRYDRFGFRVPKVTNATAIQSTNNGVNANSDPCYCLWDEPLIVFDATATSGFSLFGIWLQACDNLTFRNVQFFGAGASGGGFCAPVFYDYSGIVNYFPWDCLIDRIDFGTTAQATYNNGSPGASTKNQIINIGSANGQPSNPSLPGLKWGLTAANP